MRQQSERVRRVAVILTTNFGGGGQSHVLFGANLG